MGAQVPTWTGRAGLAGAPDVVRERAALQAGPRPRFGSRVAPGLPRAAPGAPPEEEAGGCGGAGGEGGSGGGFGSGAVCGMASTMAAPTSSAQLLQRLRAISRHGAGEEEEVDDEAWALTMMHDLARVLRRPPPSATAAGGFTSSDILSTFAHRVPHHRFPHMQRALTHAPLLMQVGAGTLLCTNTTPFATHFIFFE